MSDSNSTISDSNSQDKKFGKRYKIEEFKDELFKIFKEYDHGLNINQVANLMDINRNTVSKYLKTLEASELVTSKKLGVSTLWFKGKSEKKAGPFILTIKRSGQDKLEIVKIHHDYLNMLDALSESVIGYSLWKFYPFDILQSKLESFILKSFQKLNKTNNKLSKEIEFENGTYNERLTFKFNTSFFSNESPSQINIEFYDMTLKRIQEMELLNSDNFAILLNLFENDCVSIQTDEFKILRANQRVLEKFNQKHELEEDTYCYSLYFHKNKPCEDCPAKEVMATGKSFKKNNEITRIGNCDLEYYPIESKNNKKGYILKIKEIND